LAMLVFYYGLFAGDVDNVFSTTYAPEPLWASVWPVIVFSLPLLVVASATLGYGLLVRPRMARILIWVAIAAGVFGLAVLVGAWEHTHCDSWMIAGTTNCRDHSAWVHDTLQVYWVPITFLTALPAILAAAFAWIRLRSFGRHARPNAEQSARATERLARSSAGD